MTALTLLLLALAAYAAIGLTFGVMFVALFMIRVDRVALGSGLWFRLFILPGVAALWPWMLAKSLRASKAVVR